MRLIRGFFAFRQRAAEEISAICSSLGLPVTELTVEGTVDGDGLLIEVFDRRYCETPLYSGRAAVGGIGLAMANHMAASVLDAAKSWSRLAGAS